MADAAGALRIDVVAHTAKFRSGMGQASGILRRFTASTMTASSAVKGLLIGMGSLTTMGGVSTMLGAGGITYSMVRFGGAVEGLNQAFHSSLAIMDDVSSTMRNKLMKTAMDTAAVTRYSAKEIAGGYYELVSAGLSAEQSVVAMPYVAKFAQAGMFNLAGATEFLTSAQAAMGKNSADAGENLENLKEIGDALVMTNKLSIGTLEQFSIALSRSGGALRIYNKSAQEGLAVLSVFADQNIQAEEGATALNITLRELSNKAIKNAEAFKQFGIAVFDSYGGMRKTWDIIRDFERVMSGKSDFGKKKILIDLGISEKTVNYILKLIGMSEKMEDRFREIGIGSKGMAESVAEKQMTDWMRAWAKISADLMKFGEKHVLPFVNALANGATGMGNAFDAMETTWTAMQRAGAIFKGRGLLANADTFAQKLRGDYGNTRADVLRNTRNLSWHQENELRDKGTYRGKPLRETITDEMLAESRAQHAITEKYRREGQMWMDFGEGRANHPYIIQEQERKKAQQAQEKAAEGVKTFADKLDTTLSGLKAMDLMGISATEFARTLPVGGGAKYGPFAFGSSPEDIARTQAEQEKAADEQKKRIKEEIELKKQAASAFTDGLNAWESYQLGMYNLSKLSGILDAESMKRAESGLYDDMMKGYGKGAGGGDIQLAGALEKGSSAAVQSLLKYMYGGEEKEAKQIAKEHLEVDKRSSRSLETLVHRLDVLNNPDKVQTIEIGK